MIIPFYSFIQQPFTISIKRFRKSTLFQIMCLQQSSSYSYNETFLGHFFFIVATKAYSCASVPSHFVIWLQFVRSDKQIIVFLTHVLFSTLIGSILWSFLSMPISYRVFFSKDYWEWFNAQLAVVIINSYTSSDRLSSNLHCAECTSSRTIVGVMEKRLLTHSSSHYDLLDDHWCYLDDRCRHRSLSM